MCASRCAKCCATKATASSIPRDGTQVLDLIRQERPELVLLDIWMPQVDGIGLLKEIKLQEPDLNVVMISGHGNIHTAVTATKFGAFDFLEKPVSLDGLLLTVQRALGESSNTLGQQSRAKKKTAAAKGGDASSVGVASSNVKQRTLKKSVVLSGQGLHSGVKTGLILHPLPPNSGIRFTGISGEVTVPAHLDYVGSTGYATSLRTQGFAVGTVEHLLAVLHSYGIGNLLIKVHGEVPILDGSALEFCQAIDEAGIQQEDDEPPRSSSTAPIGSKPRAASPSPSNRRTVSRCTMSCAIPIRSANSNIPIVIAAPHRFARRSHRRGPSAFSKTSPSCKPWVWPTADG